MERMFDFLVQITKRIQFWLGMIFAFSPHNFMILDEMNKSGLKYLNFGYFQKDIG